MKTCTTCRGVKPATAEHYAADRRNKDGFQGRCRACALERQKARYRSDPSIGKQRTAAIAEWRKTPDGKAARRREYQQAKEKIKARVKRWVQENPDQRNRNARAYVERHPERRRATSRTAAAKRRVLTGVAAVTVTAEQIAARVAYWGERCWVCGGEWEQIDHVKPVAKGGAHLAANLRPICAPCNRRKAAKWPFERSAA